MGGLSIVHWLIILAVVVIVFGGRGKISSLMGDIGKGINSFKSGLKDEETHLYGAEPARTPVDQARPVSSSAIEGNMR